MHTELEERSRALGRWILENNATVRAAASHFGVSKSTVHKDVTERLEQYDRLLCRQVRQGGDATRKKYKGE